MQDEYVKLEKGTVQVTRTGYGPTPLVLLSGFSTLFPGLEYGALGTELAKKFPVLIPSKFGYGYSDLTDAPRDADAIVEEYRAVLSALKLHLGSLDRVKSFVKMTVFVACPPGQADIPRAADGATWLLEQLFGRERGVPTRTTVGVTALADHFPVELEVLVELYK